MKKLYILGIMSAACVFFGSCNDEWKDELHSQMISFKAPVGSNGVCDIYMRYQPDGTGSYQLPVIVSGTRDNERSINVKVGVDNDTLLHLNTEKFAVGRKDLWFRQLPERFYSFPSETCLIPAGENVQNYTLNFNLEGLDLNEKWVLPLNIEEDPAYTRNIRKGWCKALLGINLYNNYSGTYSTTLMNIYVDGTSNDPAIVDNRVSRVVDDNSIFFYAGSVWEEDENRSKYKVIVTFHEGSLNKDGNMAGALTIKQGDPTSGANIMPVGNCTYEVIIQKHETKPYLERHITILRLEYKYTDFTSDPMNPMIYDVKGSMTMQREINTLIPDQDQAIQW